jgi:antirestriction protein ArdC
MGSALLCASIGIENATLTQHASYLDNWLKILKSDKRAIFTAASHSQKATDFCLEHAKEELRAA